MRIAKVSIENFKQFEGIEVDLHGFNCLVGPNNCGKTTLLQALALFDFCVHHCLSKKNGGFELRNRTISPEEFFVLPVSDPLDIWHERRAQSQGKQRRIRIAVTFDTGLSAAAVIKLDYNRFGIHVEEVTEAPAGQLSALEQLREMRCAYLPVFSTFLPREERRLAGAIEDEFARGRINVIIRNLLLELKNKQRLNELTEILRRSFSGLKDLSIEFDEATDRYIAVTYHEENRPKEFDLFSAGSGFQQFVYLFGFILVRQPTVILLDEPDVHLHGSLQSVLLSELKNQVDIGEKQVLLATHSRELISRVTPESILSIDKTGVTQLKVAFDVYDALDRLGSLDPTQLSIVQAFRRVVVVEDATDKELLALFVAKIKGSEVWQRCERSLAFCFSKGNPWKQHDMSRLRTMLQQMITIVGNPLEMFVIADRDYYPDIGELRTLLPNDHIQWQIWQRTEIENYLLSKSALMRLVGSSDQQKTFDEIAFQNEFDRLVESSRDAANDQLVKAFEAQRKHREEKWDPATLARKAREFLTAHWDSDKLDFADAKEIVLPGLKRWLQDHQYGQFSDRRLAQAMTADELPPEIHVFCDSLVRFARADE